MCVENVVMVCDECSERESERVNVSVEYSERICSSWDNKGMLLVTLLIIGRY